MTLCRAHHGGHYGGGHYRGHYGDTTGRHYAGTLWKDIMGRLHRGTFLGDMMWGHHGGTLSVSAAGSGWLSSVRGHPPHTPPAPHHSPTPSSPHSFIADGATSPHPTPPARRGGTQQPSPPMSPSQCPCPHPQQVTVPSASTRRHPHPIPASGPRPWTGGLGGVGAAPGPPSQPLQGEGLAQPHAQPAHREDL